MPKSRLVQWYGWQPDLPDRRDLKFKARRGLTIPKAVDLRPKCPPVQDQGELGSCTGNAIAGAIHFQMLKQRKVKPFPPSRLFIYYNERAIEGTISEDSGAMIRDGMKAVNKQGVCDEFSWPYNIKRFKQKPPTVCYKAALNNQVVQYQRLNSTSLDELKSCLASGEPFVFGFSVYESFESDQVASTGEVPMPGPNEALLGGHAVLAVGYNDDTQRFTIRNSWGTDWGNHGYFTLPYSYLTDTSLSDDFWYIKLVE